VKLDKAIGHDVLEGMLNSIETLNDYRAHYKSSLTLENVVDFLILNPQLPKSFKCITENLLKEFKQLPKSSKSMAVYEDTMLKVKELLESMDLHTMIQIKEEEGVYVELDKVLSELSDLFLECSNAFSNTYFSHNDE